MIAESICLPGKDTQGIANHVEEKEKRSIEKSISRVIIRGEKRGRMIFPERIKIKEDELNK